MDASKFLLTGLIDKVENIYELLDERFVDSEDEFKMNNKGYLKKPELRANSFGVVEDTSVAELEEFMINTHKKISNRYFYVEDKDGTKLFFKSIDATPIYEQTSILSKLEDITDIDIDYSKDEDVLKFVNSFKHILEDAESISIKNNGNKKEYILKEDILSIVDKLFKKSDKK